MEGPCSCWQRSLAAEPGRVSQRAAWIPTSPPCATQAGQLPAGDVTALPGPPPAGQAGCSSAGLLAPRSGCETRPSWGGVPSGSRWPPGCVQSLHPSVCPRFLASKVEMIQPPWGYGELAGGGCAWGTKNLEGAEETVAGIL